MLNEARKKNFLASFSTSKNTIANATRAFMLFDKKENETNCDFCEMPLSVIQPIIDDATTSRSSSVIAILSSLKSYVSWCRDHHFPTSDAVFNVVINPSKKITNETVGDPAMLRAVLDTIFDDPKWKTTDIVYRAFFWFAYMGLYDTQAIDLNIDDVDLENMIVIYKKKKYDIPIQAKEDIYAAVESTYFVLYHEKQYYETECDRAGGRAVLRTTRLRRPTLDNFRAAVSKKVKPSPFKLSYRKILLSGWYYRWYMAELNGENLEPHIRSFAEQDYAYRETLLTNKKSFDPKTKKDKINTLAKQLEKDYRFWKETYKK